MQQGARDYYREHPDRLNDERSRDAVDWSYRGIEAVLAALEDFDVSWKPGKPS